MQMRVVIICFDATFTTAKNSVTFSDIQRERSPEDKTIWLWALRGRGEPTYLRRAQKEVLLIRGTFGGVGNDPANVP